jgi:hypothetical protein
MTSDLLKAADDMGVDVFEILLKFAAGDAGALGIEEPIAPALRLKAALEAAQYIYPKRKAIELNVDTQPGPPQSLSDEQLIMLVRAARAEKIAEQKG